MPSFDVYMGRRGVIIPTPRRAQNNDSDRTRRIKPL
jgi:hypothetical protein